MMYVFFVEKGSLGPNATDLAYSQYFVWLTVQFMVMCYNILCDKYCTRQLYSYCPPWALNWEYRRKVILEEIQQYNADIVSLQVAEFFFYARSVIVILWVAWFLQSGEVRESQRKLTESGKVRKFKSTRVHKLIKMQKKILNCLTQTAYNSSKFFCSLHSQIIYTPTFKFVSLPLVFSVIASNWKSTLVFCVNKLVREKIHFVLESQGKWIL